MSKDEAIRFLNRKAEQNKQADTSRENAVRFLAGKPPIQPELRPEVKKLLGRD